MFTINVMKSALPWKPTFSEFLLTVDRRLVKSGVTVAATTTPLLLQVGYMYVCTSVLVTLPSSCYSSLIVVVVVVVVVFIILLGRSQQNSVLQGTLGRDLMV